MQLHEYSTQQGNWLFRWRSFLPLFLIAMMVPACLNYRYLADSPFYDEVWEIVCISVSFFGLVIRAVTVGHVPKGTSGRNTKKQLAESLNTTGIYSLLRNPLYLGNYFMMLGVMMVMAVNAWWLPILFTLAFWLYYERIIMAEEAFLAEQFGEEYTRYAARTSAFVPNFRHWVEPELPFSPRSVLRREYSGFFALVSVMYLLELVTDYLVKGKIHFSPAWTTAFLVSLLIYLALRTLKKHTGVLNAEGR